MFPGMKKSLLYRLLVSSLVVCLVIQGWRYVRYRHYSKAIPSVIEVSSLLLSGENTSLWVLLVPMRSDHCGGAIFSLSRRTAREIQETGVEYFKQATYGRGSFGKHRTYKVSYGAWRETPVPTSWVKEGSWPGIYCIRRRSRYRSPEAEVLSAAKKPGSYYSRSERGERIIVIPELRLVSYTSDD